MLERPQTHDPETELLRRCRDWPLLRDAANAWLLGEPSAAERADAARDLLDVFDSALGAGTAVADADPADRRWAIGVFLDGIIDRLGDSQRERLLDLVLFPAGVPTGLLAELWGTTVADVVLTCRRLRRDAVFQRAELTTRHGIVQLDDTVRDHLLARPDVAPTLAGRHRRLLDAVRPRSGDWADLPTGGADGADARASHLWTHLGDHLLGAGDGEGLAATARRADWLAGVDAVAGAAGVERVLDRAPGRAARLVELWRRDAWNLAPLGDRGLIAGAISAWGEEVTPTRGLHLRRCWPAPDAPSEQLLRTLAGCSGTVLAVAWSPDGSRVAGGTSDGEVVIWDPDTGIEQVGPDGHLDAVTTLAWSPDGDRVVSGGGDGTARVWDVATGNETGRFECFTGPVLAVAWSVDGSLVATGDEAGTARVWDPALGTGAGELRVGTGPVRSVAWSPDGGSLAVGCEDGTVAVWPAAVGAGTVRAAIGIGPVRSVAWSPDGGSLAVGCGDGTVAVWDPGGDGPPVLRPTGSTGVGGVASVAWSLDGTHLATTADEQVVRVWELDGWREVVRVEGRVGWMVSAAWSPDGVVLATGGADGTVRVWDPAADGVQPGGRGAPPAQRASASDVAWSPDGSRFATAGDGGPVTLWPAGGTAGGAVTVAERSRGPVTWAPDGTHLAMVRDDGTVAVVDGGSGAAVDVQRHDAAVVALAWSPDGGGLAVASGDDAVVIRRIGRGVGGGRGPGASGDGTGGGRGGADDGGDAGRVGIPGGVASLAWSRDGARLAVGAVDGTVHLWSPGTDDEPLTVSCGSGAVWAVAWSPDGAGLATASADGSVRVLDPGEGALRVRLVGHSAEVRSVGWSPDGSRLVSVSDDRTLRVWDPAAGVALTALATNGALAGVGWSPDGKLIAATGPLGTHLLALVDRAVAEVAAVPGSDRAASAPGGASPVPARHPG